ncbi:MAG: cob(I)yrinic acid a,c-diamide adenosyltransferase [Alistipes sp.]|nr:cob(I)yrinic acid a,c-diamide adenosyltransferase [Alistipes sp.]MBR5483136.1 cob(I)yrinic acid a,c-diamide adenosyltransferase [Alistipes sp.]
MKVYTKTGDKGTTSLIGGERVAKCDCRVEAYGTVDELTAFTALLADKLQSDEAYTAEVAFLRRIESQLMTVAALLAVGEGGEDKVGKLQSATIEEMEQAIDSMQEALPQITKFTIPGGDERLSLAHVCRTICRRAERQALRAAENCNIEEQVIVYLNRLSDYFYLLGRSITHRSNVEEILWIP